jgi:anti-sigma regulatory factor (Ser/Thr protein kinase)
MDRVAPHELPLPARADSVSVARRYFAGIAHDRSLPRPIREAGSLVVSELVTNAVLHGRDPITLRVTALPSTLRVAVSDGSDRLPATRGHRSRPTGAAEHGRGLAIVARVADQWGCEPSVQTPGKTVWCVLSIGRDRGT